MRILLTNDDGIEAPGLRALAEALRGSGLGKISVVAPMKVQSATSHAVTFHRAIGVRETEFGYAVDGRPADCVKLGLHALFAGEPPFDLVVSGMNAGANVGINVLYSGTVGAAREANFCGVPAVAVSLHIGAWDHDHWARAAGYAAAAIEKIVERKELDGNTLLNVNVPVLDGGVEPRGMKVVPASLSRMVVDYERGANGNGEATYKVCNVMTFAEREPGTDVAALYDKYVTVTPLHFDTTCPASTAAWRDRLEG
ncbi:MAG: 5'/3'-nucleotidase SurE [Planctomycetota bacterium]